MKNKLTKRLIDSVSAPPKGFTTINDTEISGFQLRVHASGRKVFHLYYRFKGRDRRPKIGTYGDITVDQARRTALQWRGSLASGIDPVSNDRGKSAAPSLAEFFSTFRADYAVPRLKPRTIAFYDDVFRRGLGPRLGKRLITDIVRQDIERVHASLRSKPTFANHTLTVAKLLFNKARAWGVLTSAENPCYGIEKFEEGRHERFLSKEEQTRLADTLVAFEEGLRAPVSAIAAIRLLLLTGCRKNEILSLTWKEVDLVRGELLLEDSKTGRKRVYLNEPALTLLEELAMTQTSDLVINGKRTGVKLSGLQKIWERIRQEAKLEDVRLHDLRHNFASIVISSGASLPIVGRLLGHKSPESTKRYAHLEDEALKAASEAAARKISI